MRECLVEVVAAGRVSVSTDGELERWIVEHDAGELGEGNLRILIEIGLSGGEEHVAHIDDEATRCVCGGQHAVELFKQTSAQFPSILFGFLPGGGFSGELGIGCVFLALRFGVGPLLGERGILGGFGFGIGACLGGGFCLLVGYSLLLLALDGEGARASSANCTVCRAAATAALVSFAASEFSIICRLPSALV